MKTVLLSFDIEEFDMPFEYGKTLALEEQLAISREGCRVILDLLEQYNARATFFSTVVFAQGSSEIMRRIVSGGHEVASHGYYHSVFHKDHLSESRVELEKLTGQRVAGFRMPRMMPVDDQGLQTAGYHYNSSINPVWLPGRYDNRDQPRTVFERGGLVQLPASATPSLRIPLFWLSFHNFPLSFYKNACRATIDHDHYLNVYFHPWEFTDLSDRRLGMPWYVRRNSGESMKRRFDELLSWMHARQYCFYTISEFLAVSDRVKAS